MQSTGTLSTPTPISETARLARFFDEEGVTEASVLQAVDLILQRTDVFLDDALAVTRQKTGFESACKAGCGFCCHTMVTVAPPEAFFVAHHIGAHFDDQARNALKEKVTAYARRTQKMDGAQRYMKRESCPFLREDDWYCGLHKARPLVCRAMHSGSLSDCKAAYEARDANMPAPTMAIFFKNTEAYMSAYISTLRPRGLAVYPVELAGALSVIWREEDAFARWLDGEDIFADAKLPVPQTERVIEVTRDQAGP